MPKTKVISKTKKEKKKEKPKKEAKKKRYFEAVGRRKTSTARVRIVFKESGFVVNNKPLENYFPTLELQKTVTSPFIVTDFTGAFGVSAKVKGGGSQSQAEAVRHGITKALTLYDPELRRKLKKTGYLTRDPRMRERKKFGLKRARRAPQWKKR